MSRAIDDVSAPSTTLRAVSARGPTVELVSTTGARDRAVLVYRSADLDETAIAPPECSTARVYGLAVRIGPSRTSSGEVAQESCTEVWRTSIRFDADRSSAMAWIMAIAHRRAVDRLRSARDTTAPPPVTPLRSLGRRARRYAHLDRHTRHGLAMHAEVAQVREALARLDPEQREALELAYLETEPTDLAAIMSTLVTTPLPREPAVEAGPSHPGPLVWPPGREAS
jgi:RNA polymerase sigma-70 factor (ECF subfamily)